MLRLLLLRQKRLQRRRELGVEGWEGDDGRGKTGRRRCQTTQDHDHRGVGRQRRRSPCVPAVFLPVCRGEPRRRPSLHQRRQGAEGLRELLEFAERAGGLFDRETMCVSRFRVLLEY